MQKKSKKRYLLAAIVSITLLLVTVFAVEYFTYTQTLYITELGTFDIGASTISWTVLVNEQNTTQYVPGDGSEPTLDITDASTYAFNVTTYANDVCAVEIALDQPVSSSDFSSFNVAVLSWSGSSWTAVTLYAGSTGSTTVSYLDGLASGSSVYIHQAKSTSAYYLVEVTYSFIADDTVPTSATFVYTPLPLRSFS